MAESKTPDRARLLASSASPAAPAPERAPLAARRSQQTQRLVPFQRGGQHLDGAVPVWLCPPPTQRHGLRGDARRDALRLRGRWQR
jgi:hypothetical protein